MQSNRTRIRKDFAPLTTAVSLVCTTPAVPLTQVFNGGTEYEPDRRLTPTIILPEVVANASDGSWGAPSANHALADMKWFVNGKDIATLSDWAGKYEIDQNGSTRGAITIKRNISPGEQCQLHFEAVLVDNRLGVNLPIISEEVILSTTEKADDGYSISIGDSSIIQYDPVKDRLALYEYKVAHGLISASAAAQKAATDKCAYLHTVPFEVYHGKDKMASGFTARLYRINSTKSLTEMTAGNDELVSKSTSAIVLDLRLVNKATYALKAFVGSKEVAMVQFGVSRIFQTYNISPTNGTSIHPLDTERYDEAMVDCDGNIVECPGSIFKIQWFTDTESMKGVSHNEGDTTLFQLSKTGIGDIYSDSYLEVYCESEYKSEHKIATDGSNILVDVSGNKFIFN